MIKFKHTGDFKKTEQFFKKNGAGLTKNVKITTGLNALGQEGVEALREATPKRTGKTSESWSYSVEHTSKGIRISWSNSNVVDGNANVALLIQNGHGTPRGTYVEGIDYINPALRPIFDRISDKVWTEVTSDGN